MQRCCYGADMARSVTPKLSAADNTEEERRARKRIAALAATGSRHALIGETRRLSPTVRMRSEATRPRRGPSGQFCELTNKFDNGREASRVVAACPWGADFPSFKGFRDDIEPGQP
jgi:hypothetical protein